MKGARPGRQFLGARVPGKGRTAGGPGIRLVVWDRGAMDHIIDPATGETYSSR